MSFDSFDERLYTESLKEQRISQFAGAIDASVIVLRVNDLYEAMGFGLKAVEELKHNPSNPEMLRRLENQMKYISSLITEFKTDLT